MITRWIESYHLGFFLNSFLEEMENRARSREELYSELIHGCCDYYREMAFQINQYDRSGTVIHVLHPDFHPAVRSEKWREGWRVASLSTFDWLRTQKHTATAAKHGALIMEDYCAPDIVEGATIE